MKSAVHNMHVADIVLCDAHTKCLCFVFHDDGTSHSYHQDDSAKSVVRVL